MDDGHALTIGIVTIVILHKLTSSIITTTSTRPNISLVICRP